MSKLTDTVCIILNKVENNFNMNAFLNFLDMINVVLDYYPRNVYHKHKDSTMMSNDIFRQISARIK